MRLENVWFLHFKVLLLWVFNQQAQTHLNLQHANKRDINLVLISLEEGGGAQGLIPSLTKSEVTLLTIGMNRCLFMYPPPVPGYVLEPSLSEIISALLESTIRTPSLSWAHGLNKSTTICHLYKSHKETQQTNQVVFIRGICLLLQKSWQVNQTLYRGKGQL